jgi:hypothetical protein
MCLAQASAFANGLGQRPLAASEACKKRCQQKQEIAKAFGAKIAETLLTHPLSKLRLDVVPSVASLSARDQRTLVKQKTQADACASL